MKRPKNEPLVLHLVGEEDRRRELPAHGVLVLGSSRERADFLVPGQGVADAHCAIGRTKGGGWAVKDLGSAFGTRVNGRRVESARLEAGDQLLIGSRRLVVERAQARAGSSPQDGAARSSAPVPAGAAEPAGRAGESARAAADSDLARSAATTPPVLGGYRIVRLLGRGSQGNVYLAVQESLNREVALKVLSRRVEQDREFIERFQAEARAAAALSHPNVVTVYDVGEDQGHHFLSMEYMERGSLEERVSSEGPLPWREVVEVLLDISSALVYAESKGIVHRDIKPANLMQNAAGTTKLADLGLAAHAESEADTSAEGGGRIFGTPHFISPEQVRGLPADRRSDLYSLGATAYRLLTGRTPYEGESSREILRALLRDEPVPITELVPGVPAGLVEIVERAMRKEPEERYPSAGVLREALLAFHQGRAPLAPGQAGGRRWLPAAVLVLIGGAGAAWWLAGRGGPKESGGNGERTPVVVVEGDHGAAATAGTAGTSERADLLAGAESGEEGAGEAAIDDDTRLARLETQAELEYLRIEAERSLSDEERLEALRVLAERFAGTTSATRATERADALEAKLLRERREAAQHESAVESLLARMREAAALGKEPFDPGAALRALAAVPGTEELATDPLFEARRRALVDEIVDRGIGLAKSELARVEEDLAHGRFAEARERLSDLRRRLDLPVFSAENAPTRLQDLLDLAGRGRDMLEGFEATRQRWLSEQAREDAGRIAGALRGEGGVALALARLDLDAAAKRLDELSASLVTEKARAWSAALRDDVGRARRALAGLSGHFEQWRRRTVTDPRERGKSRFEAIGARPEGIVDEQGVLVPWSAYGARTADVAMLFHERLDRPWSEDERRDIAALLRLTAVAEARAAVIEMFQPTEEAVFTAGEAEELRAIFDEAEPWCGAPEDAERLALERTAASLLAEALRGASEGDWTRAAAALERLIAEAPDSLLVRLLSNGEAVAPPPPPEEIDLGGPRPGPDGPHPAAGDPEIPPSPSGTAPVPPDGEGEQRTG